MANITRKFSVVGKSENKLGLKIAFATSDAKHVNQHFGSAKSIVVYSVTPKSTEFISVAEFPPISANKGDDKIALKLRFLQGCVAIYCRACGASAIQQLLDRRIQPMKVVEDLPIKLLIKGFQTELNEGPAKWLAKAIIEQRGEPYRC